MTEFPIIEGEVDFDVPNAGKPCKTWYKILGSLEETTAPVLIGLHGGPGSGHEYLVPLADLYRPYGIPTLLYDQIGCGRSTHLREKMGDAEFWSFDLFIKELDNLIDHLNIRERGSTRPELGWCSRGLVRYEWWRRGKSAWAQETGHFQWTFKHSPLW